MSSINYVHDGTGNTYIPPTQRPDGTWRRPIRVRDGYVPQEEQPLYVSKGKQEKSPYPVGLSPADFNTTTTTKSPYFEIGNYVQTTKIPGLNFVNKEEDPKSGSGGGGGKKKKKSKKLTDVDNTSPAVVKSNPTLPVHVQTPPSHSDPTKRLRNLKKKLKDIQTLELKIQSGELSNPEKDQLEKIQRKDEVIEEMEELEKLIESMSIQS